MQYLRCLWVLFLVTGIILSIKHAVVPKYEVVDSATTKLIINIIIWLLGGLWLYLLLIFFGITI